MSLHSTTDAVKKTIFGICIAIGVLIFVIIIINFIKGLIPKKPVLPTVTFGKLPAIDFPTTPQKYNYSLQTVSGRFPDVPSQVSVYQLATYPPDLLAFTNAKALISANTYPNDPQMLSDSLYQWTSPYAPFNILTYDILSHNFTLTSSYATDQNVIAAANLGDSINAQNVAKNFFTSMNAFPSDIDTTKTMVSMYSINGDTKQLQPATLATAQIFQVDFFQKDVDTIPLYYPQAPHSLITALVGATDHGADVVQATYIHRDLTTTSGTYPLKTPEEAFTELETGSSSAYIAAPANPPMDPINIRTVSLGYYVSQDPQQYLMPIFVMQGDNGFYGYVSAISNDWIDSKKNMKSEGTVTPAKMNLSSQ